MQTPSAPDLPAQSHPQSIRRLLRAVTAYSGETGSHLRRVCSHTVRLGTLLDVGMDEINELRYGALLHDIGKQLVPGEILHKPDKLDAIETDVMRAHCSLGAHTARKYGFGDGVVRIVLHHHERFDGMGYPFGLAGGDIPLGARVLAVVDAVDTIMHERTYDPARSYYEAQAELLRCAGTQFDPHVSSVYADYLAGIAGKMGWLERTA